jgi:hypothetical protein
MYLCRNFFISNKPLESVLEKCNTMKKKLVFVFTLMCTMCAMATQLVVHNVDETMQLHDVSVIGKWLFVNDSIQLLDKNGAILAQEAFADVRKIDFLVTNEPDAVDNVSGQHVWVYPNPTHDVLIVKGTDVSMLRVFDMQGRLLLTENSNQVNVSGLLDGTYLLQIGTQIVRFIKQ